MFAAALIALLALGLPAPARADRHVGSFRGLGTWIDLYDGSLRADPESAVAAMHADGVRILYLETSNDRAATAIVDPAIVSRFIVAAHAVGMRVVAWYLPSFGRPARDRSRSLAAIRFRTPDGQRFDAFALDIESTAVADPALRTARLLDLSKSIRSAAGGAASLGAIVPAPVAMRQRPDYWPGFPFSELRRLYDVFLPMDYFTYHYATAGEAHDYTAANISLLRRRTGDAALPIHVIGGIADTASVEQVTAFVHAEREWGVLGASLYDDATTTAAEWTELASVPSNPVQSPPLPLGLPSHAAVGRIPGGDRTHPHEVFARTPGLTGSYRLRYRGYDLQAGEVELWVNWQYVRTLRSTAPKNWSGFRHPDIPAGLLHPDRGNYIQFVRAGPPGSSSSWGVRDLSLVRAG